MTIWFQNPGELDIRGATIMGLHAKEGDHPVGFFGTGLKYAIAVLLRTGHEVVIHSGETEYSFTTIQESFRNEQVDLICMQQDQEPLRELGFTTDLGKNWEVWQAYRELRSNAQDEGGRVETGAPAPTKGTTLIAVTGTGIQTAHAKRADYFIESSPMLDLSTVHVHKQPGLAMFYRGINVGPHGKIGLFTYNMIANGRLTEDRTMANTWQFGRAIGEGLAQYCEDERFLRKVLTAPRDSFEAGCILFDTADSTDEFIALVTKLGKQGRLTNQSAKSMVEREVAETLDPEACKLTATELTQLKRAKDFCNFGGFPVQNYPIIPVEVLPGGALGLARNETIFVARNCFGQGTKQVAACLIEEWAHLAHGFSDESRNFQNWLFDRLVSAIEDRRGEPV